MGEIASVRQINYLEILCEKSGEDESTLVGDMTSGERHRFSDLTKSEASELISYLREQLGEEN